MGIIPVMTKAEDPWNGMNLTVYMHMKQTECTHMYLNQTIPGIDPDFHCPPNFDGLVCWPPTVPGERTKLPCPIGADEYQTTQVQRTCLPTGDWIIQDLSAVYGGGGDCRCVHCEHLYILSNVGYALSFTACAIAFLIFFCSRTLHCTRNRIHWHLISSFMLKYVMYFIQPALLNVHSVHSKRIVQFLLYYFEQTNYFWMFVEGLYLHTLVVFALKIDADKISFWVYCIIGWGIPSIFVGVYATVSAVLYPKKDFVNNDSVVQEYACVIGPILIVLVVNCFFLLNIVRLLMSKLRMHGSRSSDIKHYRRAARATLVLVVLLGVGYVLMICLPILGTKIPRMGYLVFKYINSLLSGTQGLAVAVIYVFLNTEVRTVLRRKWRRRFGNNSPSCLFRRRAKARTSSYSKYDDQTCVSTMRSLAQNDTVLDSCYQEDEPGHNRGQQLRSAPYKSPGGVVVVVANGDATPKKEKPQKLEMKEVKTNGNVVTRDNNANDKRQEEAEPLLEDGVNPPKTSATIVISEATPEHTRSDDAAETD